MIKPPPKKYKCVKCSYSKVVAPKSDCLSPTDFVASCPKCGSDVEVVELSAWDRIFSFK